MGLKNIKIQSWRKSLKAPFAIYLDLQCLLKNKQSCENNPEKSYTKKKKTKHEPSGLAMFTKRWFDEKKTDLIIVEENIVLKNCVKS